MAQTVNYAFYAAGVSGVSLAPVGIVRRGRIRGLVLNSTGAGNGAGALFVSVVYNTGNDVRIVNDPDRRSTLARLTVAIPTAVGTYFSGATPFIPLDVPCEVGDVVSVQIASQGTAPTSNFVYGTIIVAEA